MLFLVWSSNCNEKMKKHNFPRIKEKRVGMKEWGHTHLLSLRFAGFPLSITPKSFQADVIIFIMSPQIFKALFDLFCILADGFACTSFRKYPSPVVCLLLLHLGEGS